MSTMIIVKVTITITTIKTTRITDKIIKTITTTTAMETPILIIIEIIEDKTIIAATTTTRAVNPDQRAAADKITADTNRILDHIMTRTEIAINPNSSNNKSSNLSTFLHMLLDCRRKIKIQRIISLTNFLASTSKVSLSKRFKTKETSQDTTRYLLDKLLAL